MRFRGLVATLLLGPGTVCVGQELGAAIVRELPSSARAQDLTNCFESQLSNADLNDAQSSYQGPSGSMCVLRPPHHQPSVSITLTRFADKKQEAVAPRSTLGLIPRRHIRPTRPF